MCFAFVDIFRLNVNWKFLKLLKRNHHAQEIRKETQKKNQRLFVRYFYAQYQSEINLLVVNVSLTKRFHYFRFF